MLFVRLGGLAPARPMTVVEAHDKADDGSRPGSYCSKQAPKIFGEGSSKNSV